MKKSLLKLLRGIAVFAFWILIWAIVARGANLDLILPAPLTVFKRLASLAVTSSFYATIALSFLRILLGFLLGAAAGILLGILSAWLPLVNEIISPAMSVVKATPVASFIIMVILWIEKDSIPVFICFLMVLPILWESARFGARSIPREIREMARVFRIRGTKKIFGVYAPIMKPSLLSAGKTALGLAWKAGVAAEVLALPRVSIGTMIYQAKLYLETVDLYAWTLAIILISMLLEKLFTRIFARGNNHAENH